jgi:hypothetical protein
MYRVSISKNVTMTCPHCESDHSVPVQVDEDGPYGEIETEPCHHDECEVKLCSCCPQFVCDGCGLKHCLEHRTMSQMLDLCPDCAADIPEPECECVRIDVDLDDPNGYLVHGPASNMARRQLEREAADEVRWAEIMRSAFEVQQ